MEIPARRLSSSEARRTQIAAATIAVLARRGYAGTTFEAICEHAGLSSKRLISYHFAGKADLLATVTRVVAEEVAAFVRPAVAAARGDRGRLEAYIRASLDFAAARPEYARARRQIDCNAREQVVDGWLAGLFEGGQRAGAFRAFDPELMSAVLRASIDGVAGREDPGAGADELVEIFDRATRPGCP
ncbi:DNA-binding transcriptional regulator, AcrR family [Nonomuraea solani]|uniref:DNA-binding transcriptional regulator, AcrR family n=1 Tax=Nonomuraea solani TaxID=1144553 RepID=A0A1H6EXX2_9ACTN|nr:TetR/AcrR family transcriptional regulator [Nonomuraea solani]SEH02727.1 DNA-binding transcriptional regulator, AcrR family [Nonomuraea solani]